MQEKNMGHICPIGRSGVKVVGFNALIIWDKVTFYEYRH